MHRSIPGELLGPVSSLWFLIGTCHLKTAIPLSLQHGQQLTQATSLQLPAQLASTSTEDCLFSRAQFSACVTRGKSLLNLGASCKVLGASNLPAGAGMLLLGGGSSIWTSYPLFQEPWPQHFRFYPSQDFYYQWPGSHGREQLSHLTSRAQLLYTIN